MLSNHSWSATSGWGGIEAAAAGCRTVLGGVLGLLLLSTAAWTQDTSSPLQTGTFSWQVSPPLFSPLQRERDEFYSVKDPSIVQHDGQWHLFVTVRGRDRSHQIEHIAFADWDQTADARRTLLGIHDGFYCAPQIFYYRPHGLWYLVCQASDPTWDPEYGAAYSTTKTIGDPRSWTPLKPMGHRSADGERGLDFWVIGDGEKMHLFFTTLDGRMWREETTLDEFPLGWSEPVLALKGDIFEASHTYKLLGEDRYLTIIEAQHGHGWRYFKAYTADRLDGEWTELAATKNRAFANQLNTHTSGAKWTDNFSHGELLRTGSDERLQVDPANLRCVFQGVLDKDRAGRKYGEIPWKLGLLTPVER